MYKQLFLLLSIFLFSSAVIAGNGLIHVKSDYDVSTTADRYQEAVKAKGMAVFGRIDHAAAAVSVGKALRPTELIIFGNPKVGSLLMQCQQSIGIDLPQKALIWKDTQGDVWLTYNEPKHIAERHALEGCKQAIIKITKALQYFANVATKTNN